MLGNILTKAFGSRNQRLLKAMNKTVVKINVLEAHFESLSDDQLVDQTAQFKQRLVDGETQESLIPEAFAAVREASKRALGLRHFDVQLIGGMVLLEGKIAEMRTGEGKTLVATLPAYLNVLNKLPVHVVTVNDYLARRDAEWMGKVYEKLGLSVGVIQSGQAHDEKKTAYEADIVYGTNNEYGFDYLRDNMAFSDAHRVQRGLGFAIVDEVDSILIDEARTPLIISGPSEDNVDVYHKIDLIAPKLEQGEDEDNPKHFTIDEKAKRITMSEDGLERAEELLLSEGLLKEQESLYDVNNISLLHHVDAALRAHHIFKRDVDYIVQDNEIVIIDEFTGRMMAGRRWSDGLHQAVEAKEKVKVQQENQTLASITFQNYFRLYEMLSGMTGTADTEAPEFEQIYDLEVVVIPPNTPTMREDNTDQVYRTIDEKFVAIRDEIQLCIEKGQPVLVGTASIESSELLSQMLEKEGIKHALLNAKQHEHEAEIIVQAGQPGTVTIATNMAGRGTDIVLGGSLEAEILKAGEKADVDKITNAWEKRHQQVIDAGGLYVIGTERNESRRVDNQLRGRCGRQGDPGESRFYLSLEDNLMRIFGSEKIANIMQKLGMEEGEAIEHPWVNKAIENAQRKVEGHNFDIRKQLLEYDDVANEQRKVIYQQRNTLISLGDVSDNFSVMIEEVVDEIMVMHIPPQSQESQWDVKGLEDNLLAEFGLKIPVGDWLKADDSLHEDTLREKIEQTYRDAYQAKEDQAGSDAMRHLEKSVMLQVLDERWKEHLANMDHLRQGIGLRGYAQKDPKQEYKREAFSLFEGLLDSVKFEIVGLLSKVQFRSEEELARMEAERVPQQMEYTHPSVQESQDQDDGQNENQQNASDQHSEETYVREGEKIGRNQPCPCGSGLKYKKCHGKL